MAATASCARTITNSSSPCISLHSASVATRSRSTRRRPAGAGALSRASTPLIRCCRRAARWIARAEAGSSLHSLPNPPARWGTERDLRRAAEKLVLELTLISTLNGVLFGMLLFLMASGLTLIFSMMGVLNFAHASFYMLGAFFGFQISRWAGFWPALILAPVLVGIAGAIVERFGLRNVHKHGHVAELLFTFGLAFVIEELVQIAWGKSPVDFRVPAALDFSAFTVFSTTYPAYKLFMLVVSIAIFVGLFVMLTRTRIGLIVQAALTHPHMVAHLGHNVPLIFMSVFGVGAA